MLDNGYKYKPVNSRTDLIITTNGFFSKENRAYVDSFLYFSQISPSQFKAHLKLGDGGKFSDLNLIEMFNFLNKNIGSGWTRIIRNLVLAMRVLYFQCTKTYMHKYIHKVIGIDELDFTLLLAGNPRSLDIVMKCIRFFLTFLHNKFKTKRYGS